MSEERGLIQSVKDTPRAEIAVIEAQWTMAAMRPRDIDNARAAILEAAKRLRFAESAHFLYKRSGKEIKGVTIRAAEEMVRNWGNLDFGFRILSQGSDETEGEAFCIDMQCNSRQSRRFIVSHIRNTKRGSYRVTDQRDISEMVANRAQRLVRACITSMIPADIIEEFDEACEATIRDTLGTIGEARTRMISAFEPMGIERKHLSRYLGKETDDANAYDILRLRRVYTSIKEGMTSAGEWFEGVRADTEGQGPTAAEKMQERVQARKGKRTSVTIDGEAQKPTESLADKAAIKRATGPDSFTDKTPPPNEDEQPPEGDLTTAQTTQTDPAARRFTSSFEEMGKEAAKERAEKERADRDKPKPRGPAVPPGTVLSEGVTATTVGRIKGAFERIGITKEQIEKKIGKPLNEIKLQDVEDLRSAQRAIKSGKDNAVSLGFTDPNESSDIPDAPAQSFEERILQRIESANTVEEITTVEDDINDAPGQEISEDSKDNLYDKVLERYQAISGQ